MKRSLLFLIAACSLLVPAFPLRAETLFHRLDIRLDPERSRLDGSMHLALPAGTDDPLLLRLAPQCDVHGVSANGRPLPAKHSGEMLAIDLPEPTPAEVRIEYRAVFSDQPPANPSHDEDPSYGITASITTQGAFLSGAWYPLWPEHPARYQVRIETPRGYQAVTSGTRMNSEETSKSSITTWRTGYPLRALALAAGREFPTPNAAAPEPPTYRPVPPEKVATGFAASLVDVDFMAPSITRELTLDGALDEPDWATAPAAPALLQKNGAPPQAMTEVRTLHGPTGLYLGAVMHEPDMANLVALYDQRDLSIYNDDCLEILLDTAGS